MALRQLIGVQGEGFGTNIRIADIAVSDLSGDDVDDVALCTGFYGAFFNWVTIRPSDGDSLVAYSDFAGLGSGHPNDVDVADLDEDGDDDLVVMASVHDLVLIEVETGEVVDLCRRGILGTSMVAGVGDFDLDGNEDLVVLASHDRKGNPTHVAYFVTR